MCGICGIYGPGAGQESNREVVRSMRDALAHRGPDGEGLFQDPDATLGHRRLAVIDLEHGRQPMSTGDGQLVLVYNGEIYNYLELRQELIRSGSRLTEHSDTEVLLQMYREHGPDCVHRLSGMFAFAVHDRARGQLFAARDQFGVKPLYFCELPQGQLVFASEIKALLQHPQVRAGLDARALGEYLTFQFCLGDRTLFPGIRKLLPGHCLTKSRDGGPARVSRYWQPKFEVDFEHGEEYFCDRLLMLLQDSVKVQMRSDVRLGCHLSGGLDSSAVVTLAAAQYGPGLKCFTGRFAEGPSYDESAFARAVAAETRCECLEVTPTAQDFMDHMPRLIYHMDEPAAGPGLFPQYMVSRLAREHVTVVLGGQGGDELFGGYARYLIAYLEQCLKGGIFETSDEGRHILTLESIIPSLPLLKEYVPLLRSFWREGLFEDMDRRYFRLVDRSRDMDGSLAPEILGEAERNRIFEEFRALFNGPETSSYLNRMTRIDQETLLPALLQVEDRVSMAVSLESRVPLLDTRIAQLVASMPPTVKFKGGQTKHILRQAMANLLPPVVLDRKDKMGFPVPLDLWWKGPLRDFACDLLLDRRAQERGIYEPAGIKALLARENGFGRQLWGLICLELWHRAFLDGSAA